MSLERMTEEAQSVVKLAAAVMMSYGDLQVDTEHILMAFLEQSEDKIQVLLKQIGVDLSDIHQRLDEILKSKPKPTLFKPEPGQVFLTPRVVRLFALAEKEADRLGDERITIVHILMGMVINRGDAVSDLLRSYGVTTERIEAVLRSSDEGTISTGLKQNLVSANRKAPSGKGLTLQKQLSLVEPMPKQKGGDRYQKKLKPICKKAGKLSVFPEDFWEGLWESRSISRSIRDFLVSCATKDMSLDEWRVVLLGIRNFYRLNVHTSSQGASKVSAETLIPALEHIYNNDRDKFLPLLEIACNRENDIVDRQRAWQKVWESAKSLGATDAFLKKVAEGHLNAALDLRNAYWLGKAALLFAMSGDRSRARELFQQALAAAQGDARVFVETRGDRITSSFSPGSRDAEHIRDMMKEAGV